MLLLTLVTIVLPVPVLVALAEVPELVFLAWDWGELVVVKFEICEELVEEGEITVLKGILLTAVIGMAFNPLI